MTQWHLTPERASARQWIVEEIARLIAHYDFAEYAAINHLLIQPENHAALKAANFRDGIPAAHTLLVWFRRSQLAPRSDTHITDGLTPLQLELFTLLQKLMHPDEARRETERFLP